MTKLSWMIAIAAFGAIASATVIGITALGRTPKSVRIGYAISLTGPNAVGAGATVLPNYRLWVKEVNAAGGIMLKSIGNRVPIEVIEYDDESKLDKALAAIDKLINHDRVDILLPPWGTGLNMAVGPLFHDAGYPHLVATSTSDSGRANLWPNSFWFLSSASDAVRELIATLDKLRSEDKIGNTVAMVSVADQFGIGFAKAARKALEKSGFEIIYDRPYAVGHQDMLQMVTEAKHLNPDCFLAFSYPPDTMAITEQARASNFNAKVFYTAVGTAYPLYQQHFGVDAEGVMGIGGWNPNTPESKDFRKRHLETTGQEPDRWASPVAYASLEMLQQALERVGKIDRAAVIKELQTGTFQTIVGPIKLENNVYKGGWAVGQWQNGEFYGIAPATGAGAQDIMFPKPAWHSAPAN